MKKSLLSHSSKTNFYILLENTENNIIKSNMFLLRIFSKSDRNNNWEIC